MYGNEEKRRRLTKSRCKKVELGADNAYVGVPFFSSFSLSYFFLSFFFFNTVTDRDLYAGRYVGTRARVPQ